MMRAKQVDETSADNTVAMAMDEFERRLLTAHAAECQAMEWEALLARALDNWDNMEDSSNSSLDLGTRDVR